MSRFVILMYHMISEPRVEGECKYACPPPRFSAHIQYLWRKGYNLIGMDAVQRHLDGKEVLPPNSVALTLDDGYRDNYENAFPVIRQWKVPATIFLATEFVGGTNEWMEARGMPRREMLTWGQVQEMRTRGVDFGAHTVTHCRLDELSDEEAMREIGDSKKVLEARLGVDVGCFAYPYGRFSESTLGAVRRAGFRLACSTRSGFNRSDTEPLLLRRIEVFGTDPVWKLAQKITFGTNDAGVFNPMRYYLQRLKEKVTRCGR